MAISFFSFLCHYSMAVLWYIQRKKIDAAFESKFHSFVGSIHGEAFYWDFIAWEEFFACSRLISNYHSSHKPHSWVFYFRMRNSMFWQNYVMLSHPHEQFLWKTAQGWQEFLGFECAATSLERDLRICSSIRGGETGFALHLFPLLVLPLIVWYCCCAKICKAKCDSWHAFGGTYFHITVSRASVSYSDAPLCSREH